MNRRRRRRAVAFLCTACAGTRSAVHGAPPAAGAHRALADCGATPAYTIDGVGGWEDHYAGSQQTPIVLKSGCPVSINIAAGEHAFLRVSGFNETFEDRNPRLQWTWSVTDGPVPLTGYTWSSSFWPVWLGSGTDSEFDWYWWPQDRPDGDVVFPEGDSDFDIYHCFGDSVDGYYQWCMAEGQDVGPPADYDLDQCGDKQCQEDCCGDKDLRERGCNDDDDDSGGCGDLRVGISAWEFDNATQLEVTATLIFHEPVNIAEGDLAALNELWGATCGPWSSATAPPDWCREGDEDDDDECGPWSWEAYQVLASEDASGERDSRRKPYCDWDIGGSGQRDCKDVGGIVCEEGRITELNFEELGLRGVITPKLLNISTLKSVRLGNNLLSGPLPQFASTKLERLLLSNNYFNGTIGCDYATLKDLELDRNNLEGSVPECLLNSATLQTLDLGHNRLDGPLPVVTQPHSPMLALRLPQAGLSGSLNDLAKLTELRHLDLSRNFLTGTLDTALVQSWTWLMDLDLSWNYLEGSIPEFPSINTKKIDLGHNAFSGELLTQFQTFAENQRHGEAGWLHLDSNSFCGPLPEVLYDLLYDTHTITNMDVAGNHFRCAVHNRHFDGWARVTGHDWGECTPVAVVAAAAPVDGVAVPGAELVVTGEFVATTEAQCAFVNGATRAEVAASYISSTELRCSLPTDWPPGPTTVEAAHYCDDFSSVLDDYVPVHVDVSAAPTAAPVASSSSSSSSSNGVSTAALGGGVAAAAAALVMAAALAYIIRREMAGKPLFVPAARWEANPIAGRADDFDSAKGGDVELEIRHLERLKDVDLDVEERKDDADAVRSPRHAVLSPRSSREGFS